MYNTYLLREKVETQESNRLINGIVIGTSTSVDLQEIERIGRPVTEIYEGVL